MYILFCFILFIVLVLVDICTFDEVGIDDYVLNLLLAFVPIVNFFIALKLVYEFLVYVFTEGVDGIWDKFR